LKDLEHSNIVRLYEIYHPPLNTQQQSQQQQSKVYFVSELCSGGSLQSVLELFGPNKTFDYITAKFFISQIIHAISYLHARGICHRNISLQNILFSKPIGNDLINCNFMLNNIKLVNFSTALIFRKRLPLVRPVGDMYIRAPEVNGLRIPNRLYIYIYCFWIGI